MKYLEDGGRRRGPGAVAARRAASSLARSKPLLRSGRSPSPATPKEAAAVAVPAARTPWRADHACILLLPEEEGRQTGIVCLPTAAHFQVSRL